MSSKIKIKSKKYKQVERPIKINWLQHMADSAGCGTIRVVYPSLLLNQLNDRTLQTSSMYTDRFSPHKESYTNTSFVVFQRSATIQQLEMIKFMKQAYPSLPIIYEIDDSLTDIPEWNFAHSFYQPLIPTIKEIVKSVDGIITSTTDLKRKLIKHNKNINVIPNHLPKFIWGDAVCNVKDNTRPRIMYAGSFNHFNQKGEGGDMDNEFIRFILGTLDKYQWVFVGGIPHELNCNPKVEYHGWKTVYEFPNFLRQLEVDIMLAPLENNTFNASKSNIKALESVALGVPLVCSNVEPYKNLSIPTDTTEGFINQVEMLGADVDKRYGVWYNNHQILKDQLYWEDNDNANVYHYINQYLKLVGRKL